MRSLPRTYHGVARASGPLLYLAGTRHAELGEWVEIEVGEIGDRYRGQTIEVGDEITVVQVLEDT
ncbi:MAG: V-type ATP synthase subunit B, partial [Gemmatimonadota bacterium]|nr:V-type ATP synthase subunit B [Gemmatimonadota bacterium]